MRVAGFACAALLVTGLASVQAQADQSVSLEAIRKGLRISQPSSLVVPPVVPSIPPESPRLGFLTLVPPDFTKGQMVKIAVPIGDLANRLARTISTMGRQRRERKAREAVERELRQLLAPQ